MCPVPLLIEVAAIKRDQRTGAFEDRVGLIGQRLTARGRKSRCQPANRFELTDLIECELGEALKPHRRHPYPEPAASVVPVPFEWRTFGQWQQRVIQIMTKYPNFVDTRTGKNSGDPFVIALALQHSPQLTVVTEENGGSDNRPAIPHVCGAVGIKSMNLLGLIQSYGWSF